MIRKVISIALICSLAGCDIKPEKINYGEDQCAYCKMSIADHHFGGEFVSTKGRIYKFDAVECMIPFQQENDIEFSYTMVTPYNNPGTLIEESTALFVLSDTIRSPMGAHLAVFDKAVIENHEKDAIAKVLTWEELKKEIRR